MLRLTRAVSGSGRVACSRLKSKLAQPGKLTKLEAGASCPSLLHVDEIECFRFPLSSPAAGILAFHSSLLTLHSSLLTLITPANRTRTYISLSSLPSLQP